MLVPLTCSQPKIAKKNTRVNDTEQTKFVFMWEDYKFVLNMQQRALLVLTDDKLAYGFMFTSLLSDSLSINIKIFQTQFNQLALYKSSQRSSSLNTQNFGLEEFDYFWKILINNKNILLTHPYALKLFIEKNGLKRFLDDDKNFLVQAGLTLFFQYYQPNHELAKFWLNKLETNLIQLTHKFSEIMAMQIANCCEETLELPDIDILSLCILSYCHFSELGANQDIDLAIKYLKIARYFSKKSPIINDFFYIFINIQFVLPKSKKMFEWYFLTPCNLKPGENSPYILLFDLFHKYGTYLNIKRNPNHIVDLNKLQKILRCKVIKIASFQNPTAQAFLVALSIDFDNAIKHFLFLNNESKLSKKYNSPEVTAFFSNLLISLAFFNHEFFYTNIQLPDGLRKEKYQHYLNKSEENLKNLMQRKAKDYVHLVLTSQNEQLLKLYKDITQHLANPKNVNVKIVLHLHEKPKDGGSEFVFYNWFNAYSVEEDTLSSLIRI